MLKTYKEFMVEELSPEQIEIDAAKAVNYIKSELEKMFSPIDFVAECWYSNKLGKAIEIVVLNVPLGSSHLDRLNAKIQFKGMMYLSNSFGKDIAMSTFSWEKVLLTTAEGSSMKFRKINGSSPYESSKKLVAWLKKNRKEFDL